MLYAQKNKIMLATVINIQISTDMVPAVFKVCHTLCLKMQLVVSAKDARGVFSSKFQCENVLFTLT